MHAALALAAGVLLLAVAACTEETTWEPTRAPTATPVVVATPTTPPTATIAPPATRVSTPVAPTSTIAPTPTPTPAPTPTATPTEREVFIAECEASQAENTGGPPAFPCDVQWATRNEQIPPEIVFANTVNAARVAVPTTAARPRSPMAYDDRVASVAAAHADWMLATGIFEHVTTDAAKDSPAKPLVDGLLAQGYCFAWGENLSQEYNGNVVDAGLIDAVVNGIDGAGGLMQSPAHRRNILSPFWTHTGVGIAGVSTNETTYFVQHFCQRAEG